MGIQSSINSALGTLRVLGALKTGKNYIDQQVQKGAKSVENAVGEVKDTVKESTKDIKGSVDSSAEAVKSAADKIEQNFITWMDRDGTEMFGKGPNYDPDLEAQYDAMREEQDQIWEDKQLADKYRGELERAKSAQQRLFDKLKSKMEARDNVNNMKDILKGNKNLNGGAN